MPRMDDVGVCTFNTAIGLCGLSWTRRGIERLVLPEEDRAAVQRRLTEDGRRTTTRPPAPIASITKRLRSHLGGRSDALRDVPLDLSAASPFAQRVYRALRRVGPGQTVTYGQLARRAGQMGGARAVGRTLARNPLPLLVPCHRVLAADGGWGGFSARGGIALKARLLFIEGVIPDRESAAGIAALRKDRTLRRIIGRVGPYLPRIAKRGDPYDALVASIIYQQLSGKAAATIAGRVRALTPGSTYPQPDEMLALRESRLRSAGLSRQKLSYLKDLAHRITRGQLDLSALRAMDDAAVAETLCQVKGIGRWSAHMFLMFHLGRMDVLPVDDLGFRKAVQTFWKLPALPQPDDLVSFGERWKPYRSMATWYLWQGLDRLGED